MSFETRRTGARPMLAITVAAALVVITLGCGQPVATPPASVGGSASPGGAPSPSRFPSAAGSAASGGTPAVFDPSHVAVGFEPVVGGLVAPLAVVNAYDGSGRLFVAQQGGQIRIVRDGKLLGLPFLDIADRITSGGERGLLGVAFHPHYPADPRVFVDYTDSNGDTRVSAFRVDPASPDRL
ncbi:MAG TPA: PQQ-dependent sugar dehydrogenase, partial [Candidatus Limnocylindrales bacterium]